MQFLVLASPGSFKMSNIAIPIVQLAGRQTEAQRSKLLSLKFTKPVEPGFNSRTDSIKGIFYTCT